MQPSIGFFDDETELAALAVGRQTEVGERLVGTVVPGADLEDLSRLVACRDLASELLRDPHNLLDLLDRGHALALAPPEVVLDAHADVEPKSDGHGPKLWHRPPQRFDGHRGTMRRAADILHEVERIAAS